MCLIQNEFVHHIIPILYTLMSNFFEVVISFLCIYLQDYFSHRMYITMIFRIRTTINRTENNILASKKKLDQLRLIVNVIVNKVTKKLSLSVLQ